MFFCRICDVNIGVEHLHRAVPSFFHDYLTDTCPNPEIILKVFPAELEAENARYPEHDEYYNELMVIFKKLTTLMLDYDTFFFHSAVVELNGDGYIFTGKSGAGKSTHAMLWQKYLGADVINGDKPLFRLIDGKFYAYGNPWSGKEGLHKNSRVEVKAAAFIEQSSENSIAPISSAEVLTKLFNQAIYVNEPRLNGILLGLLDKFLLQIPFYRLECNISREAAMLAYNTMKGEN